MSPNVRLTAATPETMSKGDFAALCNVDKSRVSHWIKDGKISGPALVGTGRSARIVVEVAQRQLKSRLDPDQRMGNGAGTKLDARPAEPEQLEPVDYVWKHVFDAPAYAALSAMVWGADLRIAYLTYRSVALAFEGNLARAFGVERPLPFDEMGFDFLEEEFGAKLGPDDLAAWDREFEHQWDEDEDKDEAA